MSQEEQDSTLLYQLSIYAAADSKLLGVLNIPGANHQASVIGMPLLVTMRALVAFMEEHAGTVLELIAQRGTEADIKEQTEEIRNLMSAVKLSVWPQDPKSRA